MALLVDLAEGLDADGQLAHAVNLARGAAIAALARVYREFRSSASELTRVQLRETR